jgi:predicted phage terminase large subunit-like protein
MGTIKNPWKNNKPITVKDARHRLGTAEKELRNLEQLFKQANPRTSFPKVRLIDFVREFWPVLEPGVQFQQTWHIELIAEYLEAFHSGAIKRLIINCPPRSGKSLLCSILYPVWAWTQKPKQKFIFVSYADPLSLKFSGERLKVIQSKNYQLKWGNLFDFRADQNEKRYRVNSEQGHYYSVSGRGQITGYGANRIIYDDPNPLEDATSKASREAAWEIGYNTVATRLDEPTADGILVVQQRIHPDDITGRLIKNQGVISQGGEWHWVRIPAIYEDFTCESFGGIADPRAIVGESFWPDKFPTTHLEKLRQNVGEFYFASQYQQTPVARQGGIFQQDWFADKILELEPTAYSSLLNSPDLTHVRSWDLAASDEKLSSDPDYTVGLRAAMSQDGKFYIFGMERFRKVPAESYQTIVATAKLDGHQTIILIEQEKGGSSSVALAGIARQLGTQGYVANPIAVKGQKEHRADLASVHVRTGQVYLVTRKGSPNYWLQDFFDEILSFPKSAHKDITDAFTQAVIYLSERKAMYAITNYGTSPTMDLPNHGNASPESISNPNALWG